MFSPSIVAENVVFDFAIIQSVMTENRDFKTCVKCKQSKPTTAFGPSKQQRDGLHPWCRACRCADQKARHAADPAAKRAWDKERRVAHSDAYKAKDARWAEIRSQNADYLAEQRQRATERLMQAHRLRGTVQTCAICGVQFCPTFGRQSPAYKTCSEECSGVLREHLNWRKGAKRRAWVRNATIEYVDPYTVFFRDGWTCHICGTPTPRKLRGTYEPDAPELDHIVPLSKGGDHSYANVACACRACNIAKGNRSA